MTPLLAVLAATTLAAGKPAPARPADRVPAVAAEVGEEVEVSAGVVTALRCARAAQKSGKLEPLASCAMTDVPSGLAVFDVAAGQIYRIAPKKVGTYELEAAFGGGSIDFAGVVVGSQDGVPVVEVAEYTVSRRPKAGSFKGCL